VEEKSAMMRESGEEMLSIARKLKEKQKNSWF
jgi:hypothetical protein